MRERGSADIGRLLERAVEAVDMGAWDAAARLAEQILALHPENAYASALLTLTGFRSERKRGRAPGTRRRVTVMFCDMVGSTDFASGLDPEQLHDLLQGFLRSCTETIEKFDGHVVSLLGDGLLAYFGFPRAHEDDAVRAVLAGWEILSRVQALPPLPIGGATVRAAIRIGIHSGLAVATELGVADRVHTNDLVGETPTLASRIQAMAVPNSVVISSETADLTGNHFDVRPLPPTRLRGIDRQVRLFQVAGSRAVPSRFDAVPRLQTGLVGRRRERQLIGDEWTSCVRPSRRALALVGEAGMGKSRLLAHARAHVSARGGTHCTLQCSPYHVSTPLHPVVSALERERMASPQERDGPVSRLGDTFIPGGAGGWRTWMFNYGSGSLRACGKAGDRSDIACTPWMRAGDATPDMYHAAVDSLLARYSSSISNWDNGDGWWRSANAVTALLDYIGHTGDCSRFSYVTNTWSNNATLYLGNFRNPFFDDTGWWALAWMRAADIAGSCDPGAVSSLMNTAEIDFDYMQQSGFESASSCGGIGGMWWNTDLQYKASIANGLFLELAGGLYNRTGQTKYLDAAKAGWQWYTDHHVIDPGTGLVIDGYDGPNAQSPKTPCGAHPAHYTYNQGAVIGGLVELYRATSDATYLDRADGIAQATIAGMTTNGILREDSEVGNPNDVGAGDGAIFKGVFTREARPLYDLDARLGRPEASSLAGFLRLQLQSLIPNDRSGWGEYGYHWTGPIRNTSDDNAWTQTSAVDAFNAAAGL